MHAGICHAFVQRAEVKLLVFSLHFLWQNIKIVWPFRACFWALSADTLSSSKAYCNIYPDFQSREYGKQGLYHYNLCHLFCHKLLKTGSFSLIVCIWTAASALSYAHGWKDHCTAWANDELLVAFRSLILADILSMSSARLKSNISHTMPHLNTASPCTCHVLTSTPHIPDLHIQTCVSTQRLGHSRCRPWPRLY